MNAKTSQSPDYGRKKISEPLTAAVFDYKKPDLKKIETDSKPVILDEVKKPDNKFGKKNKAMFVSLFRGTEPSEIEIKEEDVE